LKREKDALELEKGQTQEKCVMCEKEQSRAHTSTDFWQHCR